MKLHTKDMETGEVVIKTKPVKWLYEWWPWFIPQHPEMIVRHGKDRLNDGKYVVTIEFELHGVTKQDEPDPVMRYTLSGLSKKAYDFMLEAIE